MKLMGTTQSISLVMMGLDNAGKSTALYRMKCGQYCETIPTIGFNCERIKGRLGKSKDIIFTIWDVGGQDRVRPLWRTYAKGAEAIIFVIDSSDHNSIEEAKIELAQINKYPEIANLPILILANKQDLPGAIDIEQLHAMLNLNEIQSPRLFKVICACAITGDGLDEALEYCYEMIVKQHKMTKFKK